MTARTYLILIIVLANLPVLAISFLLFFEQRNFAQEAAFREAERVAATVAGSGNEFIEKARGIFALISKVRRVEEGGEECAAFLADALEINSFLLNMGVAAPDGNIICGAGAFPEPLNLADSFWFKHIKESRDFTVGEYQITPLVGKPIVYFGYPVLDQSGMLKKIIFSGSDISWIEEFIREFNLPTQARLMIIDEKGVIIAQFDEDSAVIGRDISKSALFKNILAKKSGTTEAVGLIEEVPRLYAFAPLGIGDEPDAYIAVSFSKELILGPVNKIYILNVSAILVWGIMLAFLAFFGSEIFISRRIKKIKQAAMKMAAGDFSARINPPYWIDELGLLAKVFDEMASRIEELYKRMEEKIRKATSDLSFKVRELESSRAAILNILQDLDRAKTILEREKARFQATLESIGDGFLAVDKEGIIFLINEPALKMFGVRPDEATGKLFSDFFSLEDEKGNAVAEDKRPIKMALTMGQKTATDLLSPSFNIVKKDKTKFPAALSVAPIKTDGETLGAVAIIRDITKEKIIDKAKTEFVSLAAHQLRTPLSIIKWYGEMLLSPKEKMLISQKRYLREIYKGNERMIELVNALLNATKVELGTFLVSPQKINLIPSVEESISQFAVEIKKKNLVFEKKLSSELPKTIMADPQMIPILVQNLLGNAVKYTPPKGKVSFEASCSDEQILFRISDTGYGIPKEAQSKIFTKLFRADNVKKRDTTGTGLGLYIVKAIVEQSGGKIWFESEENKGTTFYALIPVECKKYKALKI